MDFHTLTRKALQALCKQNGIPANITNVAMADSLAALQHVEGLEELLSQSPEKIMIGSASVSRTAARTTTRRAPTKKTVAEGVDQGKTEVPPKTPAAPSTRRRAPAASACQKMETLTETTSVQRAYSTRRSVRLLGKTMSKMSLDNSMTSSIEELSSDTMDCSEQSESSVVKGTDMQPVLEGSSNGIDASEVLSELKSNGQVMDENLVKDSELDVIEVQKDVPVQESGMNSEVSAPKAASDAIMNSEVMDESSKESSADVKEPPCEVAQELVKDSDDVIAAQSALAQELNKPPSAVKNFQVELISSTLSSTPTKSPASKVSDVNVAATTIEPKEAPKTEASGDFSGKFDFESGSSTEGDSEDEGTEDESVDEEASSEHQDNMNDTMEASEEDSDDESTEGESSEEDDSDDDITEEEYSEDEAVAADISEKQSAQKSLIVDSDDDITEEESSEDEAVADISEKQSAQKSLIVDSDDDITEEEYSEDEVAADISEKQSAKKSLIVENADANMSEGAVVAKVESSSPLPVNIATQFPRPTSAKSSGKKRPEIAMHISDDIEESLDTSTEMDKDEDLKEVEIMNKDEVIAGKEEIVKEFEAKSLRELKKLLKSKLKIGDSKDTKVVEKPRIALSEVPENQMGVQEN